MIKPLQDVSFYPYVVPKDFFERINEKLQERNKTQHEKFCKFLEDWVNKQPEMKGGNK